MTIICGIPGISLVLTSPSLGSCTIVANLGVGISTALSVVHICEFRMRHGNTGLTVSFGNSFRDLTDIRNLGTQQARSRTCCAHEVAGHSNRDRMCSVQCSLLRISGSHGYGSIYCELVVFHHYAEAVRIKIRSGDVSGLCEHSNG